MRRAALLLLAAALTGACGDAATPASPELGAEAAVVRLDVGGGEGQRIWSGRRSQEPFRVRALDAQGRPVRGARVTFEVEAGGAAGVLSQPEARTDADGWAESFLLETRSGDGALTARSGGALARFGFTVDRAPGELRFAPAAGGVGLPGLPHPDSLVSVQVIDTEGRPLAGTEVWFVGPERVSSFADTSDADGWASTRILRSQMRVERAEVTAFVLGFPEVIASTERALEPAAKRVLLVSIDGLRADALERWSPPTLLRLAAEGAWTTTARTVAPALTVPAHLSLLSGVAPESHGVWSDDLEFTPAMASLDPLFRHAGRSGLRAHAFMSLEGPLARFEEALQCKLAFGLDSLTLVAPDAELLAGAAMPSIRDPEVQMVFLHVPDPDLAGHAHGFESAEYGRAVMRADSALARVVEETDDETLLIVVSDHGGGGDWGSHLHGSAADVDALIPMILWGERVGHAPLGAASILDVPATALWALGLRPPAHYEGQILLDAFR